MSHPGVKERIPALASKVQWGLCHLNSTSFSFLIWKVGIKSNHMGFSHSQRKLCIWMCSQTKKCMVQVQLWSWAPKPTVLSWFQRLYQRLMWAHPWALALINLGLVLSLSGLCYSLSTFSAVLIPLHSWATSSSFHNHFYCTSLLESLMILKALEIH